jgi:hypothetical protein
MRRLIIWLLSALAVGVAVLGVMWQSALVIAVVALVAAVLVPRRSVLPVATSVLIALMIIFPVQYMQGYGGLSRAVLYAAPAVTAWAVIRSRSRPRYASRGLVALMASYLMVLTISTFLHEEIAQPALLWATIVPAFCLALLLGLSNSQQVRRIEQFTITIAIAESLYALMETSLSLPPLWTQSTTSSLASQIIPGVTRAQGTLAHPLPLALLCIAAVALLLSRRHEASRFATVAGVAVLTIGVVATGSRSALATIALMLAFSVGRRVWTVLTVAVLSAAIVVAGLGTFGFFHSGIWRSFISGDSVSHRNGALASVPRLFGGQAFDRLVLGNGYFSAPDLFRRGLLQRGAFYAVDNQLVTTLVEVGVIGVLLIIAICALAWVQGSRYRMLVFAVVAFFFTFDLLSWPSAALIFTLATTLVATGGGHDDDRNRVGEAAPSSSTGDQSLGIVGRRRLPGSTYAQGSVS